MLRGVREAKSAYDEYVLGRLTPLAMPDRQVNTVNCR